MGDVTMVEIDEINIIALAFAIVCEVVAIYWMFFSNPERWEVVPMSLKIVIIVAMPVVVYFVADLRMNS